MPCPITPQHNGIYLMLYCNTIPQSELGQQWGDDGIRPEEWEWHYPLAKMSGDSFPVETRRRPMPDDIHEAYEYLVTWLISEAAFDQLFKQPQVSHIDYHIVADWCLTAEKEDDILCVPKHLSPVPGIALPLGDCGWFGLNWSRYPRFILDSFKKASWPFNISTAYTDPRHPDYEFFDTRDKQIERAIKEEREAAGFKTRPFIKRAASPPTEGVQPPVKTGNPLLDALSEFMRD